MVDFLKKVRKPTFVNIAILTLLALYVGYILFPSFVFLLQYVVDILTPFFIALIFYYILRPVVQKLQESMSIYAAIFIAYIILLAFFAFTILFISPVIYEQVNLIKSAPIDIFKFIGEKNLKLKVILPKELQESLTKSYSIINKFIIDNVINFITALTGFFISLVISLFILFYYLKDDKKFYKEFLKIVPRNYFNYTHKLLRSADFILVHFINGRVITALIVSVFVLITFLLIGIKYPFLLAFTSMIFFIIPTLGCFIAMILPLIVGFSTSTIMGIEVLVIMSVASILEGLLVAPKVMEQTLYIHPLTLILLFLISGSIYGIFGLLFATPVYVLLKVFCTETYAFYQKRQPKIASNLLKAPANPLKAPQ